MSNKTIGIESPVPSLLISNLPPNVQQENSIREAILLAEMYLEDQRQHLDDTVQARVRHGALASFVHSHRALLSSVRRVPYEIWDIIIRFTVSDANIDNMEPLRLIGNVCRLWNAIAKSIQELRGILPPLCFQKHIPGSVYTDKIPPRIFSNPPSTGYFGQFSDPISVTNDPRALIGIMSYVSRWRGLSIVLDRSVLWDNANFLGNFLDTSHLSQLRLFIIKSGHKLTSARPLSRCDTFDKCTSIREVDLDCDASFSMGLPWDNLTSYKERSHGRPMTLERLLLGITTNNVLEHLGYQTPYPSVFFGRGIVDRILLPRLRHIDIRVYHDSPASTLTLLDKIHAPSIETLRVRDRSHNFLLLLNDFLVASKCSSSLTVLRLDTCSIMPGELVELIRSTPMLHTLECNDISLTDIYLFSMHTGRGREATLVPHLRNLTIHSSSHVEAIDQMARDRVRIYQKVPNASPTPSEPSTKFAVKLIFPEPRKTATVADMLLGTVGDINVSRSKLGDILVELDIQMDEIKSGLFEKRNSSFDIVRWRLFSVWTQFSARLDGIFTYLENLHMEAYPETMIWGIRVLEKFTVLKGASIPDNVKYNFLHRANNLVHSWKDLQRHHRTLTPPAWILQGQFALLFVGGLSDPLNPSDPVFIIEEDKDLLWGEYDYSKNIPNSECISWRRKVNSR